MERLLTKCCKANIKAEKDENGFPIRVFCEQCEVTDPERDWFEVVHMSNNDQIQEIKERQQAATSGPWQAEGREIWRRGESYTKNIGGHVWIADVEHTGNKDLIAHAPSDIAYLLSEVERLQENNKAMKEALEWYADKDNYDPIHISSDGWIPIDKDEGERAITAISHLKG